MGAGCSGFCLGSLPICREGHTERSQTLFPSNSWEGQQEQGKGRGTESLNGGRVGFPIKTQGEGKKMESQHFLDLFPAYFQFSFLFQGFGEGSTVLWDVFHSFG